jgi:hypothetical protein
VGLADTEFILRTIFSVGGFVTIKCGVVGMHYAVSMSEFVECVLMSAALRFLIRTG